jgi:ABC-2 type transport system ATP-binding protein
MIDDTTQAGATVPSTPQHGQDVQDVQDRQSGQSAPHQVHPALGGAQPSPGSEPQPLAPLLLIDSLGKFYRDFPAVQGVSFAVGPGEIVGLVGPNGAGKTTILRCIAGILRPTSGDAVSAGYSIVSQTAEAKRNIALIPETPNLYELLTVMEHLRFVHMAYGETEAFEPRAQALLEHLDLWERRDSLAGTLSKGMKQKLAVACAFIHSARIFLFDEPFIGIDPAGQRAVREMIQGAASNGAAVLISSHILDTVQHLCPRVLVLHRGVLIAQGDLGQLRHRASVGEDVSLEDVFLALTRGATP